ncbi:hypothetical protein V1279_003370 [Bradyrhizobium sp. AZCC 1610]|uniref:ribbon-helix-helix domain-containing protein n=1 Tax=Bradyrhizobium sp. AZCC 1610 TaxID=3117020 RepID=UPI002FF1F8C6
MTEPIRFSDSITIRCQPEITALVDRAARAKGSKPSEWARQALSEALRAAGFDPTPKPSPSAGALYDSVEGRQRFAWVEGGEIKAMSYSDEKPADDWIPVVHVDSEPFDLALHWRLAPMFTTEAERVVCTYPVIQKSLEAM